MFVKSRLRGETKMQETNISIFPEQMQIFSGSVLKMIAFAIMLIDHTASILLQLYQPAMNTYLSFFGKSYSIYRICRNVGRLAFPIFCFLLVEGFVHTKSRIRYARNLLLFALISEIPWNLGFGRNLHYAKQNVYFTLLLGFLGMCLAEYFKESRILQMVCVFALLMVSMKLNADYSYRGYLFIMIMYYLRNERVGQALVGSCWLYYEWVAGFAFIPINMYNGKRGFIKSGILKYLGYSFYPLHITMLIILRRLIFHI